SFAPDNGRIQNNGRSVRQQRKRLLHGEKQSLHVGIEDRIEELLGDRAEPRIFRHAGIREHNIELALLTLDLRKQAIQIVELRHVALHSGYVLADLLDGRSQLITTPPGYEDISTLVHEPLRRRQANATIAAGYQRDFSF